MKLFKYYSCVIFCLIIGQCYSQNEINNCDYGHVLGGQIKHILLGDTISIERLELIPLNCDGDVKVNEYYRDGSLFTEKFFKGIPSSCEISLADPDTYEITIKQEYFYEKEPDKIWSFYDKNGNLLGKIDFRN